MSDKKRILGALCRLEIGPVARDLRTTLATLACSVLKMDPADAAAFADQHLTKYRNWLVQEADQHRSRGLVAYFAGLSTNAFSFSCPCEALCASSQADDVSLGTRAIARPKLLQAIDLLSDREYEALACVAADALSAKNSLLTPAGNEGGIDFLVSLPIGVSSHIFSAPGSGLRIVGQSKKYASPLAVDRLDQFLQTMHNVRHRDSRVRAHIPAWFDQASGPIVGWIISHSGFQSGTADEAKKHGVVLSDSLDVTELISLSTSFAPGESPSARAAHLVAECQRLL